jgi:hypothetical protein
MDNPHQGSKPPKPARVGGPHSGRRKPDFDDMGEQLCEHRRRQPPPSSLDEAARRVERQVGAGCQANRDANPPRVEVRSAGGSAALVLERGSSGMEAL